MIITHNIIMDLARNSIRASVDAVQGDKNGRQLKITLLANDTAWNIPGGAVAVIRYRRSDGTGGEYGSLPDGSAAYAISGNVITATLSPQVCAEPGKVALTVALKQGDVEINTFIIDLKVQYNPDIDAEDPEYEVEDPTLEDRVVVLEATYSKLIGDVAGKTQLTPEFANSIAECTDTSKLYVLPDGYIYAYFIGEEAQPLYTNQLPISTDTDGSVYNEVGYKKGVRWSTSSNAEVAVDGGYLSGLIPVEIGDTVRLQNVGMNSSGAANINCVVFVPTGSASPWTQNVSELTSSCSAVLDANGNVVSFVSTCGGFFRLNSSYLGADSLVTVNEVIGSSVATETGWKSTGHAFVPADYEDRIVALESALLGDMRIYGIVDEENTIFMTGTLLPGTYSLKFWHEDGTTTDIGTFIME